MWLPCLPITAPACALLTTMSQIRWLDKAAPLTLLRTGPWLSGNGLSLNTEQLLSLRYIHVRLGLQSTVEWKLTKATMWSGNNCRYQNRPPKTYERTDSCCRGVFNEYWHKKKNVKTSTSVQSNLEKGCIANLSTLVKGSVGSWLPSNTLILGPTYVSPQNAISIASTVVARSLVCPNCRLVTPRGCQWICTVLTCWPPFNTRFLVPMWVKSPNGTNLGH